MNIGIFTPYLDTLTGGERYMLTAASAWSEQHDVSLFWDDVSIKQMAGKKFALDLQKVRVVPNIFSSKTSFKERFFTSMKYDVIFFLSDGSIPFLGCKKTIVHFQAPIQSSIPATFFHKLKLARIDSFVCNSKFTKEFIDKKYNIQSKVIYPPCEIPSLEGVFKQKVILSIGRYSELPNGTDFKKHGIMIDVFKKIVDQGIKDWSLHLIISYLEKDKEKVQGLIARAHGYPIKITTNASHDEVMRAYLSSKIYWHAAGYGENIEMYPERTEHFGITTVDAMAAGCIPVVYNAGGQKEIVRNNENGFLWTSTMELVQHTILLIQQPQLIDSLRSNKTLLEQTFGRNRFHIQMQELLI